MAIKDNKKVAVITGGTSGIGRSITITLAKAGYSVFPTTRNVGSTAVKDLLVLAKENNLEINPISLDLTDYASIANALSLVLASHNKIDVLINNAAAGYFSAVEDIEKDKFLYQINVNLVGLIQTIQAVLPSMREAGKGKIINISSIMGFSTAPLNAPYSSSKYALESISETLALEVKPFGINVVIFQLGDFHTNFLKNSARHSYAENSPYFKLYKRQDDKLSSSLVGRGPEMISEKILSICNTTTPKLRYTLGKEVWIRKLLHTILIDQLWIKFLRFFYKW